MAECIRTYLQNAPETWLEFYVVVITAMFEVLMNQNFENQIVVLNKHHHVTILLLKLIYGCIYDQYNNDNIKEQKIINIKFNLIYKNVFENILMCKMKTIIIYYKKKKNYIRTMNKNNGIEKFNTNNNKEKNKKDGSNDENNEKNYNNINADSSVNNAKKIKKIHLY